jgi:tetratricopeptide (TPR) repeat protein
MLRIIREEEPPKPSTRLHSLMDSLPLAERVGEGVSAAATQNANLAITIADRRGTDPRRLQQTVRGELDWIVMKALEKDRSRRYETANSFAMDIQRYLADEPVQACPPSALYRLRKFARRNRVPLAVATSLLLLLVTAAVVGAYHLVRIGAERALARSDASDDALDALGLLVHVHPNEPAIWAARGLAHQEFNQMEKALADHTEAIKLAPKVPIYLIHRGGTYAAFGEWQKAAADFDSSLQLFPGRLDALYMSACTHLAAGDLPGYRRSCSELIGWYGQTNDLEHAAQVVSVCTLAPNSVPDFSLVEKLAQFTVDGTEMHPARHALIRVKALAELRAGRHEQAAAWLRRRALYADGDHYDAGGFAAMAMAQHGLGQTNEAVKTLAKAKAIIARDMPDPAKGKPFRYFDWHHWLHAQILCREAAELLGNKE